MHGILYRVLLFILLLAVLPVRAQETEGPLPFNISQSGSAFTRRPAALADADGTLHVVWQDTTDQSSPAVYNLFHRSRSPGGVWSASTNLTPEFNLMFHYNQTLVRQPDGTLCVMIDGQLSRTPRALYQRCLNAGGWGEVTMMRATMNASDAAYTYDADGTLRMAIGLGSRTILFGLGSEQILLSDEELAILPKLVTDSAGRLHLFYNRLGRPFSIEHRFSTDGGATWSQPESLNDVTGNRSASNPQVAVDARGGVHVVYHTAGEGSDAIEYLRWIEDGGCGAMQSLLANTSQPGQLPQIAVDADGLAHVVFRSESELFYTRQQQNGGWSMPVRATPITVGQQVVIVVDEMGVVHLLWDYEDRRDIFYDRIDAQVPKVAPGG